MKNLKKIKKISVEICRIFLGFVFVFSGFVKAVDPMGTMYKNMDYFSAFGLNVFDFAALPLAFIQIAVEFSMGVCLLLGIFRQFHAYLFLIFMCAMTPLTLYLALKNPVTDCGCFGDALIISNWQTFYKNIFLLIAAIVVFFEYKNIISLYSNKYKFRICIYINAFIIGFSFYCYAYLPILDFRPYKIGANIPQLMAIPENAPMDKFETTLIYAKDGVKQEFTIENYPKGDTTWTFIDRKMKLLEEGYKPPIHDFTITTEEGDEITDEVLSDPSYTFLLIAHKLEKAGESHIDRINEIYDYCLRNNYRFYCLTASLPTQIKEWKENAGAEYAFCTTDDITLKTIIRSNPGLLLLKNGTVINKWANLQIPDEKTFFQPLEISKWGQIPTNHNVRNIALLSIIFTFFLSLFFFLDKRNKKPKKTGR